MRYTPRFYPFNLRPRRDACKPIIMISLFFRSFGISQEELMYTDLAKSKSTDYNELTWLEPLIELKTSTWSAVNLRKHHMCHR